MGAVPDRLSLPLSAVRPEPVGRLAWPEAAGAGPLLPGLDPSSRGLPAFPCCDFNGKKLPNLRVLKVAGWKEPTPERPPDGAGTRERGNWRLGPGLRSRALCPSSFGISCLPFLPGCRGLAALRRKTKPEEGATGDPAGEGSCRSLCRSRLGCGGGARLPRVPRPSSASWLGEETPLWVTFEDQVQGARVLWAPPGVCHPLPGLQGSDHRFPSSGSCG